MFILDPAKRPSAEECLKHAFLTEQFHFTDGECPIPTAAVKSSSTRFESKSTEKTYESSKRISSESR
jgi:hypothetical protein